METYDENKMQEKREEEAIEDFQKYSKAVHPKSICTSRLRTDSSAKAGSVNILWRTSLEETLGVFGSRVPVLQLVTR